MAEEINNNNNTLVNNGNWITGKLAGGVYKRRSSFYFQHNQTKTYTSFIISNYPTEMDALEAAKKFQLEFSREKNLSKNDYRYITNDIIEVKLTKGYTMLFDKEDLDKVQRYTWWINESRETNVYAATKIHGKAIKFHQLLMPDAKIVDHIAGTHFNKTLNNKKSNLRPSNPRENKNNAVMQKNNTSGVNGVINQKDRRLFLIQWKENGMSKQKLIGYGPKSSRTEQSAFDEACRFRKEVDLRTGCTNGQRERHDTTFAIKRKAQQSEQNSVLVKRVKTRVEEYFKPTISSNDNHNNNNASNNNNNNYVEAEEELSEISDEDTSFEIVNQYS
jgi:hypothetical protein